MAYANTGLFCKFETASMIINEVDGSVLATVGDSPVVAQGINGGNGLQLSAETYLSFTGPLNISNKFTIGFWLKSNNVGLVASGNALQAMRMPVLARATFPGTITNIAQPSFVVWEETQTGGKNILKASANGYVSSVEVQTPPYETGVFRHFLIVYDGSAHTLDLYLDGKRVGRRADAPESVRTAPPELRINFGTDGAANTIGRNTGVLDELFITNTSMSSPTDIERIIRLGAEYVLDDELATVEEAYFGTIFGDTATTAANTVLNDNADFYVGRSDGKLIKAHRTMWKCQKSFVGAAEKKLLLDTYPVDKITVTNGVLTPKTMIRA